MSKLNEKNEFTKKVVHLLITSLCNRNCLYCCNKQYSLDDIPYITDEELKETEVLCLTGGEPFLFCDPCKIAEYYKRKYKNIKAVYVYTNALELNQYLQAHVLHDIDGLNVSVKTKADVIALNEMIVYHEYIKQLKRNQLYVFDDLYTKPVEGFTLIHRKWQKDFQPANDSIFRKV